MAGGSYIDVVNGGCSGVCIVNGGVGDGSGGWLMAVHVVVEVVWLMAMWPVAVQLVWLWYVDGSVKHMVNGGVAGGSVVNMVVGMWMAE